MSSKLNITADEMLVMFDRPIAFHRLYVDVAGSISGAIFLSQLTYWCNGRGSDPDGWIYKTATEWHDETGMSRRDLENVRRTLKVKGVLEEKISYQPTRLYYRILPDGLMLAIQDAVAKKCVNDVPLSQQRKDLLITQYSRVFRELSTSSYKRAQNKGVQCEDVDYTERLVAADFTCYICGRPITLGPGQALGALQFDHVVPIDNGGSHTKDNIRPTHAKCNRVKSNHDQDFSMYDPDILENINARVYDPDISECTIRTSQDVQSGQILSETTSETTTDIIPAAQISPPIEDVSKSRRVNTATKPKPKTPAVTMTLEQRIADGLVRNAADIAWPLYCRVSGIAPVDLSMPYPKCTFGPREYKSLKQLFAAVNNNIERFKAACEVYYRHDNVWGRKANYSIGMFETQWQDCITQADRGIRARRMSQMDAAGQNEGENNDSNTIQPSVGPGAGRPTAASLLQQFKTSGRTR